MYLRRRMVSYCKMNYLCYYINYDLFCFMLKALHYFVFSPKRLIFVIEGGMKERHPEAANPEAASTSQEERKRKRTSSGEEEGEATKSRQDQLIEILERNGQLLAAQLEVQNTNLKLDREQRKDHGDNLVAVLNKLADAVAKIADKL